MPSLFETEATLESALEALDDATIEGATERAMIVAQEYALAAAEKRDSCVYFLRGCEEQEDAIGREIDRLKELRDRKRRAREGFIELIREVMQEHKVKKLVGITSTLTLVETAGPVVVPAELSPESCDPRFVRHYPATFEWDKAELKRAVKEGTAPAGVFIAPGKVSVRIGPPRRGGSE